jgi:Enoyl-(Acyl carrier protein) reductase
MGLGYVELQFRSPFVFSGIVIRRGAAEAPHFRSAHSPSRPDTLPRRGRAPPRHFFAPSPLRFIGARPACGLTKSAALDYAARGIRINAVCLIIHTSMLDKMMATQADALNAMLKDVPIGRLGRPEEIASAVLWLCSSGACKGVHHLELSLQPDQRPVERKLR